MTNFILLSTIPIWCAKWWAFNRLILIIGEIILLILGWPWLRAKPLCIEIFCVVWGNSSNKIKELVLNNFDQKFMNWPEVCEILANATFLHWLRIQCIWSADFCTFTSCLISNRYVYVPSVPISQPLPSNGKQKKLKEFMWPGWMPCFSTLSTLTIQVWSWFRRDKEVLLVCSFFKDDIIHPNSSRKSAKLETHRCDMKVY